MKVQYVTGSRADFGLMQRTLDALDATPEIELSLVVTGQHLLDHYGHTIDDIRGSGLSITAAIPVELSGESGAQMGAALAVEMLGFLETFQTTRPDLVLVLGDRGEMLAATLAAVHCGICVGHIHGGEVTGTLDESFRHAISKLSHFHFTATDDARNRLIRMGEREDHIWTIGAPGLVGITDHASHEDGWLQAHFGVPAHEHAVLCVFHPVVQEAAAAGDQVRAILHTLSDKDCSGLILRPNSDAGAAEIDAVLSALERGEFGDLHKRFRVLDHLERDTYLKSCANVDLMIGNSSSGIIESASFGIGNLNIGTRQDGRQRNANTLDCPEITTKALTLAFDKALKRPRDQLNVYGDGLTDVKLAHLLTQLPISPEVLAKQNTY